VDFPPWQIVHGFFTRWAKAGVVERVRDRPREPRLRPGVAPVFTIVCYLIRLQDGRFRAIVPCTVMITGHD
jgi:hypothetical protein